MNMSPIYLDNASTTPVDNRVLEAILPYMNVKYGNPSSLHLPGRLAKKAIEDSRQKVAQIIGAQKDEIIFTSGGTESDNLAILGIAYANQSAGKHIIVSSIEHKAVLDSCKRLSKEGFDITYLDVDKEGIISLEQLKSNLRSDTILVSIMYANNEIGTIQPLKKISKIIRESKTSKPVFHTDACQAVGLLTVKIKDIGVDALTVSASKIYGPKGAGCLYLKKGVKIEPQIIGGGQENNARSGTENVPAIVGFAEALSLSEKKRMSESQRLLQLREHFILSVFSKIKKVSLNGSRNNRLSNNVNLSFEGVEGESLVLYLDEMGIYCSTGSACNATDLRPSYVLLKIGLTPEQAHCSVRFTLGRHTRKSDIVRTVRSLVSCVEKVRLLSQTN